MSIIIIIIIIKTITDTCFLLGSY